MRCARGGLQGEARIPRVYVSAHAHSSVDKARSSPASAATPAARSVRRRIRHARRRSWPNGRRGSRQRRPALQRSSPPSARPRRRRSIRSHAIAQIARRHGMWLHVDAAMAGQRDDPARMPLDVGGRRGADSLVINAHKWLGAPFDCSVYYVRDPEHLMRVMSTNPELPAILGRRTGQEPARLGHPAGPALPCPEAVVHHPRTRVSGSQNRLRRDIANARWLRGTRSATPGWRMVAPVHLRTVCVRAASRRSRRRARRPRRRLGRGVERSGAPIAPAVLDGRWMVRLSMSALATPTADVATVSAALHEAEEETEETLPANSEERARCPLVERRRRNNRYPEVAEEPEPK